MILQEQQNTANFITKVFTAFKTTNGAIKPHLVLTGSSGTGKSYLISQLATEFKFNIINVNAAQLTSEGISGNSLSKALTPLLETEDKLTVVFVDEFDKWFTPDAKGSSNAATDAIQNEFLKLLESNSTEVYGTYGKYVSVSLEKVLFIFAGAFNNRKIESTADLASVGIKREFLGRVPLVKHLEALSLESLLNHLNTSDLLKQYSETFNTKPKNDIKKLEQIITDKYDTNTIGIRLVTSEIHKHFLDS